MHWVRNCPGRLVPYSVSPYSAGDVFSVNGGGAESGLTSVNRFFVLEARWHLPAKYEEVTN